MSLEQARAFIEKMKSDEAFRNRIITIEDIDARLAAASDAGFEFTEAELKEVQIELSDDQLDQAVGGEGSQFVYIKSPEVGGTTQFAYIKSPQVVSTCGCFGAPFSLSQ